MKRVKGKLTILTAAAACLLLLAAPCRADLLYTVQDDSYMNTALGIIHGSEAPVAPLISNMGGNAGQWLFSFVNADGNYRIGATLYTLGGNDIVNVYNPGKLSGWATEQAWRTPLREAVTTLHNTRAVEEMNGYLYATAYDIPIVCRITTKDDIYRQDKKYQYTCGGDKYNGHGEALVTYNNHVFAVFTGGQNEMSSTMGTYRPSELYKFDADLNFVASRDLHSKNTDGMTPGAYIKSGNTLYLCALGGAQPFGDVWNKDTCIEGINLDTMESETLITAEQMRAKDPTFGHMFFAIAEMNGKFYIQTTKWESIEDGGGGYDMRIYETTAERLASGDIGEPVKRFADDRGYRCGMLYDRGTEYLWVAAGYDLVRFDGTEWKMFDRNKIKGNISAYAVVSPEGNIDGKKPAWSGDDSGGGGCNCAAGGLALLAFAALALIREKAVKAKK